jgi:hypothetical protein
MHTAETANETLAARLMLIGQALLFKFPFTLHDFAEILSDDAETVSFPTVRSWTNKTLRLKPTLQIRGFSRPTWGFNDLIKFAICKQLLRGIGCGKLPAAGIQEFVEQYEQPEFFKGISFAERVDGSIVLAPDRDAPEHLRAFFFQAGSKNFRVAVEGLLKGGVTFTVLNLRDVLDEVMVRLFCWLRGEKYHRPTKKEMVTALRSAGHLRDQVNSAEEALKS